MLILTRRNDETLTTSENVTVIALVVKANALCIGVNAERDVAVDREERFERKRAASAQTGSDTL